MDTKTSIILGDSVSSRHPLIPNMSVYDMIEIMNLKNLKETAIDCRNLQMTYSELIENVAIIAKSLKEIGIKKGDIITISTPNISQSLLISLAANRIGAATSFLNSGCTKEEIQKYLNLFESPLYVTNLQNTKEITEGTKVKNTIFLKNSQINKKEFKENKNLTGYKDIINYEDLKTIAEYYKYPTRTLLPQNNTAVILFTSGSTGEPKIVELTNKNIISSGIYMKNTGHIKSIKGESVMSCIPFCYPYGYSTTAIMALLCGRKLILTPNLDYQNVNYYLSKNPNYIFGSPAIIDLILRYTRKEINLSTVHSFVSGGDFLSEKKAIETIEFFKQHKANIEVYNGFGNAEGCGTFGQAVGSEIKRDTVGKLLSGMEAIIIDPETKEIKNINEEGLLCLSGKNIFKGYYKNDELTAQNMITYNNKQFFITGAIGKIENGYFKMTGRSSRFYIRMDSHKVYLEHVQKILSYYEFIESVAAVPKPNKTERYETKVYIVLKDGIKPNEELKIKIKELLKYPVTTGAGDILQLKEYEIPNEIVFVEKLPRTKADKVDFKKLETETQEEYEKVKRIGEK